MTRSRCRINSPILAGHALYVREGDSHAQRKERPCSSSRDKARVSGETVRKSASTTHLASEHRRIPPRPTRKARMFVGTSRASTHAEMHLLSCSQTSSWVETRVRANSCNNNNKIYVSTNVGCTRPIRGDSLAGLGSLHAEAPPES
jgi:hypothetical protein